MALAAVVIAGFVVRLPAGAEPLGIDQGLFASAARALSRGDVLYRDVWDQKPPAIFLTYLGAFTVFGWTAAAIAWLDLVASALTAWLVGAIGSRLGGTTMGLVAAAIYASLTAPGWLYRNGGFLERSVAETFIALAVAVAAWRVVAGSSPLRTRDYVVLGVTCGLAIAYKPNAAVYVPAILLWIALYRERGAPLVRGAAWCALGCAVFPLLTFLWLWQQGVLADARVALFDFNRFYVAHSLGERPLFAGFYDAIGFRIKFDPLWGAGAVGALAAAWTFARSRRVDPLPALAIAWGAAAALVILVNGAWLFNTYFIQALPPLALLAAWAVTGLATRSRVRQAAALAALVVISIPLIQKNYPRKVLDVAWADLQHWRGRNDPAVYWDRFGAYGTARGYSARANAEVAAYIREHSTADDRIYQFGINSAGVYFETDRLPAQRFLRVNEFVPSLFPHPGFDLAAVARELAARRPLYLIFEQLHTGSPMANAVDRLQEAPELQALLQSYAREVKIEDYTLYRRRQ